MRCRMGREYHATWENSKRVMRVPPSGWQWTLPATHGTLKTCLRPRYAWWFAATSISVAFPARSAGVGTDPSPLF